VGADAAHRYANALTQGWNPCTPFKNQKDPYKCGYWMLVEIKVKIVSIHVLTQHRVACDRFYLSHYPLMGDRSQNHKI
jgi:hypothetical protein